jgi:hypothetical protein
LSGDNIIKAEMDKMENEENPFYDNAAGFIFNRDQYMSLFEEWHNWQPAGVHGDYVGNPERRMCLMSRTTIGSKDAPFGFAPSDCDSESLESTPFGQTS